MIYALYDESCPQVAGCWFVGSQSILLGLDQEGCRWQLCGLPRPSRPSQQFIHDVDPGLSLTLILRRWSEPLDVDSGRCSVTLIRLDSFWPGIYPQLACSAGFLDWETTNIIQNHPYSMGEMNGKNCSLNSSVDQATDSKCKEWII